MHPSLADRLFNGLDRVAPPSVAHAHCDIPCGIYDPHAAQIAALSIIRMNQLIQDLPNSTPEMSAKDRETYMHQLSRYVKIKEDSAEACKHELRILWGDFFKPD